MTFAPWENRIHQTVVVGQWVALVMGVVAHAVATTGAGSFWVAMALASLYCLAMTVIPAERYRERFRVETITLAGVVVGAVILTLTGSATSPYLLLTMGPPILATLFGGLRIGLLTGLLSAGLLTLMTMAQGAPPIDVAPGVALYLVFVLLVGVVRRLFEDVYQQASTLAHEKELATQQLERLEQIHGALLRLSEDVSSGRLNAVEVAADTLDAILARHPGATGKLIVDSGNGSVVLASRGIGDEAAHEYTLALTTSDSTVGGLVLTTATELSESEIAEVQEVVYPVSLALANLQLLQGIVGAAVAEERIRLAREMHDEIGPALASLGLALDMTAIQQAANAEVTADLQVLRSNVTKLVEDVRAAVADLRVDPGPTLTSRLMQAIGTFDGTPVVVVDLEERRPPRAAIIADLTSIIVEAARNAHTHARASKVVITGQVDRTFGRCNVVDDGSGFDPEHEPEGHYGLMGMRERAAKIGASIKFESRADTGTVVSVEWGNR